METHVDSDNQPEWQQLSLTLVEYPKGDAAGMLLAMITLLPFAVFTGFLTLILFRRDLHTIAFFVGLVGNEFLNFLLKHTIQEARPLRRETVYSEYGMPSTHAQFMWFFATYMVLFVVFRLHKNSNSTLSERFWRVLIIVLNFAAAGLVTYSRIYLKYHSSSQVMWGAIVGTCIGLVWFIVVHLVVTPFFPVIVSWKVSEYLLIRDTTLIPNILWFEYTNIRAEARARSRKLVSMKSQ